ERLLITTTKSLAGDNGLASNVARELGDQCVGIFSAISAHSPRDSVIAGAEEARRTKADLLVAIGGGSVGDATKVMQIALWADLHDATALDEYRNASPQARALPVGVRFIAVPTTLSAAEFTAGAGVSDTTRKVKESYAHRELAPRAVIIDPA